MIQLRTVLAFLAALLLPSPGLADTTVTDHEGDVTVSPLLLEDAWPVGGLPCPATDLLRAHLAVQNGAVEGSLIVSNLSAFCADIPGASHYLEYELRFTPASGGWGVARIEWYYAYHPHGVWAWGYGRTPEGFALYDIGAWVSVAENRIEFWIPVAGPYHDVRIISGFRTCLVACSLQEFPVFADRLPDHGSFDME